MDGTKIKFGDKLFLYGQFMEDGTNWEEGFCNPSYNSVMGYIPIGGYGITPQKSDIVGACLPGFVVDFVPAPSLALPAAFADDELVDVTELLSLQLPSPHRVWMPMSPL